MKEIVIRDKEACKASEYWRGNNNCVGGPCYLCKNIIIMDKEQYDNIRACWESIVQLMDDDIRESVHADKAPCNEAIFLREYRERHFDKYGAEFVY